MVDPQSSIAPDVDEIENCITSKHDQTSAHKPLYPPVGQRSVKIVDYMKKSIPFDVAQEHLHKYITPLPKSFEPSETLCVKCNIELSSRYLITSKTFSKTS